MNFGVIILAAGASSRMGRPKLLLPWSDTTIIGHQIRQWTQLGADQITAVLSCDNQPLTEELNRLAFPESNRIVNPQPERGMFSSIQCAVEWRGWKARLTHFVITLGDQPHLKPETLKSLIQFAARHSENVCQPSFENRPKHPVLLPKSEFNSLTTDGFETLAHFLKAHRDAVRLVEISDPGLNLDIDTPEDYELAFRGEY